MTAFRFSPVTPHPLLSPHIAKMWVFESSGRLPVLDRKLIVPNANFKLAFSCRNGLIARVGDKTFVQKENELTFTGLVDAPVMLDPKEDEKTDTIVIEFNPLGAYRLFHLSYTEVKNQIVNMTDLIGKSADELRLRLAEAGTMNIKLQQLQSFLIKQLEKSAPDPIYDFCINRISYTKGLISVKQLEKETCYSSRWLHRKFSEHLGTGPKNLAEIIRFKQFYEVYLSGFKSESLKDQTYHFYHYYYDQSHFLRAFKRFTGSTPTDFVNSINELATKHYMS
jgi:AraC-like DNA-binding protein